MPASKLAVKTLDRNAGTAAIGPPKAPASSLLAARPAEGSRGHRRRMRIVTALLLVCGSGAWFWQIRTLASLEQTRDVQASALSQMEIDATTVRRLRASPRRASDRERPNAELLAEVDAAIATSAISKDAWQDSVPQPPRQMVGRPYVQHSTKLYLDGVNLEKVVQFCRALLEADPTLHLLSLRLTAPDRATSDPVPTQLWRVELTIGYLVFAPDSSRGLTVPR